MANEDLFGAGRLDDVIRQVAAEGGEGFRADHFISREDNMAAGYLIAKGALEICGGDGESEPFYVRVKGGGGMNFVGGGRGSVSKAKELEMVATRTVRQPEPVAAPAETVEKVAEVEPPAKESMSPLDHAREALQYIHTIAASLEAAQEAAGSGLRKMAGVEIDGE